MAARAEGVLGVIFVVTIYESGRESCRCVRRYFCGDDILEWGIESCRCVRCCFCGDDIRVWQGELQVC